MSHETPGPDKEYSNPEHWDPKGLRERIYNNDDLFAALLNSFLGDSPQNSKTLLDSVENMDLKKLKEVSHLLKGVCGQLCANRLHKICVAIEQVSLTPLENINKQELVTLSEDFSKELAALEQTFTEALNQNDTVDDGSSDDKLGEKEFLEQIHQLQEKLDQSEYIDPDSLSPLKSAYQNNPAMQNLVIQLIEQINLFDNAAASATLREIQAIA